MHAFFAATGPSIKDREDPRIPAFRNLEIHNLVMAMLGVSPTVNDVSPLKCLLLQLMKDSSREPLVSGKT